jgi:hypothetical protein
VGDALFIVQFPHPGPEHRVERPGRFAWRNGNDRHARKFLRADADVRPAVDADPETREVGLWGEWEATSDAEPIRHPIPGGPLWIHRPLATRAPADHRPRQNTDPLVFGNAFLTTFCGQRRRDGTPRAARSLTVGSLIVFGSKKDREFRVDTVFVIAGYEDHTRSSWQAVARRYDQVATLATFEPMYDWGQPDDLSFRAYRGATSDQPVNGMFSFTPACRLYETPSGFQRPAIRHAAIDPSNGRFITRRPAAADAVREVWEAVAAQVSSAGLLLATAVRPPVRC